jgi:hypothetical protein
MKITRLLAGTALALSLAGGAQAATLNGSIGVTLASATSTTQPIGAGTVFGNAGAATTGGAGDLAGIANFTLVSVATFTASVGQTFSFTSGFGDFTGNITVASQAGPANSRTVTVFALGTFTPGGTLSGDAGAASITFTANQTGGANEAISASFTLATPPAPPPVVDVPEPMSMALFGLGLAGLGVAMRRKA